MEKAYRYVCYRDEGGSPIIWLTEYSVIARTPCWFWIRYFNKKKKKRVSNSSNGYCHLDKDRAYTHFLSRTKKYIKILKWKLDNAKDCLDIANIHKESVVKLEWRHSINREGDVSLV